MLIFQLYGWRSSSGSSSSARSFAQTVDQENEANVAAASARQGVEALRSAQESASIENDQSEAASRRRQRVRVRINRTRKHVRKTKDSSSSHEEPDQQPAQQQKQQPEQVSTVTVSEPVLQPTAQTQITTASVRVTIAIADALRTQITFALPTAASAKPRATQPKRPSGKLLARTPAAKPMKKPSAPAKKSLKPLPAASLYPAWFSTAFSKRGSEIKSILRNPAQGTKSAQPNIQHLLNAYRIRTPQLTIVA